MNQDFYDFASVTHHEGAIICSYETILNLPLDTVKPQLIKLMESIQDYVEGQNGLVGHIKAYIEEHGRAMTFSAAGGDVTAVPGSSAQTSVSFTAIVFSVDEKELQLLVEKLFDEIV